MKKRQFIYETKVPAQHDDVWEFFSKPSNLVKITSFPKVSIEGEPSTKEGEIVKLKLNFLLATTRWNSIITNVVHRQSFTDKGEVIPFPFTYWEHTHRFSQGGDHTIMIDTVVYAAKVPSIVVTPILQGMFKGREKAIMQYFSN